ncbi:MAG: histidine kinase [Burkholderiaceae bacterium]|nr:histidine kinase [Burkholderiaceae bacterium]
MSPETARRPWWRLARGLLSLAVLCTLIAAFLTVLDGQFGIKLVYSFSIGLSCWVVIDGGRTALAAWRRRRGVLDNERVGWAGVVPLIIVGAVLGPLLGMAIGDALTGGQSIPLWRLSSRSTQITMAVTVLAILVSTLVASANDKAADQALRAQAAQREAAEAQLRLLQSQLEPHMLFNTLANLRVLIGLDPARAQAMLDRLIAFLRSTLAASRAQEHALSDEFARLDDYLALMQVRMGPRLQVALDLPPALAALKVPPLLLQPLVENAIRHGLEGHVDGGTLRVSASRDGDQLRLCVDDDGLGLPPGGVPAVPVATAAPAASGFGLAQVRERLAARYGPRARFTLDAGPAGRGTRACILLPLDDTP